MTDLEITLAPGLTAEQQQAMLRYLAGPQALSRAEWQDALAGFDVVRSSMVRSPARSETFAEFYRRRVDEPFGTALIEALLSLDHPEEQGIPTLAEFNRRVRAHLTDLGLVTTAPEPVRLLLSFCAYWWASFAKGYLQEIIVFDDLRRSGVQFQAHDLRHPRSRYSPVDLFVNGRTGDVKTPLYFLQTARGFPPRHEFYIAQVYDPWQRVMVRVVLLTMEAWKEINGEPQPATLEEAASRLPGPLAMVVRSETFIVVDYKLWKERVRDFQTGGDSKP
jgi:hypothetical protein